MKKILGIVCLVAAGILLGNHFNAKKHAPVQFIRAECSGIHTKAFISEDDARILFQDSTIFSENWKREVFCYGYESGEYYIVLINGISRVNFDSLYIVAPVNDIYYGNKGAYQVYELSSPKVLNNYNLNFACICMILFVILMTWGLIDDVKKKKAKSEN